LLGKERIDGVLRDISLGGAFMVSGNTPPVGSRVEFALRGKKPGSPLIVAEGEVVRNFTNENTSTDKWGFGLKWTSLKSPGGPPAVRSLFDEISSEFPVVGKRPVKGKQRLGAGGMDQPNGAVPVWIRARMIYRDKPADCIMTRLGSRLIEVRTPDIHMSPDSQVTIMMDGERGTEVRILGRVTMTYHNDEGGRSEIKVIYREDVAADR